MQAFALSLTVVSAVASIGAAAWVWHAVAGIGADMPNFAGFDELHFQDHSARR